MPAREAAPSELTSLAARFDLGERWAERTAGKPRRDKAVVLVAESATGPLGIVDARVVERGVAGSSARLAVRPGDPESIVRPARVGCIDRLRFASGVDRAAVTATLLDHLLSWLRSRQVPDLEISVAARDDRTRELLERFGFEPGRYLLRREL